MPSIEYIKGSNGVAETVRAVVTGIRSIGGAVITVNSVVGINTTFIGTTGGLDADGELTIRPQVFYGTISGSNINIDSFATGYTDLGNLVGDIVVIKPTTAWADEVAATLAVSHDDDGTLKSNTVDTSALQNLAVVAGKIDFSTFAGSSLATSANRTAVSAPQTGLGTQSYNFVNGKKYLVGVGISTTLAASTTNIRDLNVRVNGVTLRSQRFQSPIANSQSGGIVLDLYTAAATATYTVDGSMTQAAGSGAFDIEGIFTLVIPLSN